MVGEKPTGSKGPDALRLAALGVIRLIVETRLRLPLAEVFVAAQSQYSGLSAAPVTGGLLDFFAERMPVVLRDQGVRHDLITAVLASGGEVDLLRPLARAEGVGPFITSAVGAKQSPP